MIKSFKKLMRTDPAGVYHPVDDKLVDVEGAGGTSPLDAPAEARALEASLAAGWFRTITGEVFG